jgi:hypothetical protein
MNATHGGASDMATQTKTTHTSGPWLVQVEPTRPVEPGIVVEQDGETYFVATCHDAPGDGDRAANARLIAQAPAMYEALTLARAAMRSVLRAETVAFDGLQIHRGDFAAAEQRIAAILAAVEGDR